VLHNIKGALAGSSSIAFLPLTTGFWTRLDLLHHVAFHSIVIVAPFVDRTGSATFAGSIWTCVDACSRTAGIPLSAPLRSHGHCTRWRHRALITVFVHHMW